MNKALYDYVEENKDEIEEHFDDSFAETVIEDGYRYLHMKPLEIIEVIESDEPLDTSFEDDEESSEGYTYFTVKVEASITVKENIAEDEWFEKDEPVIIPESVECRAKETADGFSEFEILD